MLHLDDTFNQQVINTQQIENLEMQFQDLYSEVNVEELFSSSDKMEQLAVMISAKPSVAFDDQFEKLIEEWLKRFEKSTDFRALSYAVNCVAAKKKTVSYSIAKFEPHIKAAISQPDWATSMISIVIMSKILNASHFGQLVESGMLKNIRNFIGGYLVPSDKLIMLKTAIFNKPSPYKRALFELLRKVAPDIAVQVVKETLEDEAEWEFNSFALSLIDHDNQFWYQVDNFNNYPAISVFQVFQLVDSLYRRESLMYKQSFIKWLKLLRLMLQNENLEFSFPENCEELPLTSKRMQFLMSVELLLRNVNIARDQETQKMVKQPEES